MLYGSLWGNPCFYLKHMNLGLPKGIVHADIEYTTNETIPALTYFQYTWLPHGDAYGNPRVTPIDVIRT